MGSQLFANSIRDGCIHHPEQPHDKRKRINKEKVGRVFSSKFLKFNVYTGYMVLLDVQIN